MKQKPPKKTEMDLPKNDYNVTIEIFTSPEQRKVEVFLENIKEDINPYMYGIRFSYRERVVEEEEKTYYIVMATIEYSDPVVDGNSRMDCMANLINYLAEKIAMG